MTEKLYVPAWISRTGRPKRAQPEDLSLFQQMYLSISKITCSSAPLQLEILGNSHVPVVPQNPFLSPI